MEMKDGLTTEKKYYVSPKMQRTLDRFKEDIQKRDNDKVIIIDGSEGSGKSTLAAQICYYMDQTFTHHRMYMKDAPFLKGIELADHHTAHCYDEAYTGLSSRAALSKVNKVLVSKMMEMRQKNLFVVIVLPSFFMLDKYVALFRSTCLIHVYKNKSRRGYWRMYNQKKKKILYLKGKNTMDYSIPRIKQMKGRFYGRSVIDDEAYRAKKRAALEDSDTHQDIESRFQQQRDILLHNFVKSNKFSLRKAEKELEVIGFDNDLKLSDTTIGLICRNITLRMPKSSDD